MGNITTESAESYVCCGTSYGTKHVGRDLPITVSKAVSIPIGAKPRVYGPIQAQQLWFGNSANLLLNAGFPDLLL